MPSGVTTAEYLRTHMILHLALLAGQLPFALIALGLHFSGEGSLADISEEQLAIMLYVAAGLAATGLAGSAALFRFRLRALQAMPGGARKYRSYRTALVLRYAILEAPALLCMMLFMLSGHFAFMGMAGLLILAFLLQRPGLETTLQHLNATYEERLLLESPESVLY